MHGVAQMSRDRDGSWFVRVSKLPMAASRPVDVPTVFHEQS